MKWTTFSKRYKFLVRGVVCSSLLKTFCRRQFDPTATLVVMGAPRSGTTWLSEIVNGIPQSAILFEPISPTHVPAARKVGFSYDTYLESDAVWPQGQELVGKILRGQLLTPWTTSQIPVKEVCSVKTLIVKFVRANMLLGWLSHTFPIRPPALIVRHPCATISSQLKKGWIPPLEMLLENNFFKGKAGVLSFCRNLTRPEEILALRWCMRYHVPLALPDRPFVLISYERLVRDGESELKRLFAVWSLEVPAQALARLKRPSKTVVSDSQVVKGYDPLLGWRKNLSESQIGRILAVVDYFGLNCYSKEIEPDYDRLHNEIPSRVG